MAEVDQVDMEGVEEEVHMLVRQLGRIMQMDQAPRLFLLLTTTTAIIAMAAMHILVTDIQVTTTAVTMDRQLIGAAISRAMHHLTLVVIMTTAAGTDRIRAYNQRPGRQSAEDQRHLIIRTVAEFCSTNI